MKQKITVFFLISILLITNTGCQKKETAKSETTTEISKKEKMPKITKKELSAMKKKAEEELTERDYDIERVEFEPEYYKKIGYDSWEELMKNNMADGDVKKYSVNRIVILEGYQKNSSAGVLVAFAKEKEKWKFLYIVK